jgi:CheY-like chemotaxis protein
VAGARLNLKGVSALVIDSDAFTRGLVTQMLRGFGLDAISTCETGTQGIAHLQQNYADLCIVEGVLPDMPSTDFIGWLRKQDKAMRFIPVMVLTGYTQMGMVAAARDGGANSVVKKPVSPQALFDRINWMAKISRPFIETVSYIGPDRRIRNDIPPDGVYKRETDDKTDAGSAAQARRKNQPPQTFAQGQ